MAANAQKKLKEGFLVKKGHVRHNWKTRWFVLCEEALNYYKKKEDAVPTRHIPLKGCFLVSPCSEYTKKGNVFRLTTKEGVEFLIQAANDSEHDSWVTAIADVISMLGSKQRVNKSTADNTGGKAGLPSRLSDILVAMQDSEAGIPLGVQTSDKKNKQHSLCFTGVQAVDWLLKWSFISSREEGAVLIGALLELGHVQPDVLDKKGTISDSTRDSKVFLDDQNTLYKFSALRFSSTDGLDLDYSDDSSDSDDAETGKTEQYRAIKGTMVKKGFLQKKGHVRHNWKTRKAILCKEPPTLYYCRPTKESTPVGRINLRDAEVKIINSYEESAPSDSPREQRKQATEHLFSIRTRKGVKYVFKVTSESDRVDWVQHLQGVCQCHTAVPSDEELRT